MVKAANKVRVLKDYDIIKEGDTANSFVVELLKNGEVVDLTGATVTWKMANEKGVVVDKQATIEDNQVHLILTENDQTGDGKMRVEIRVEKDGKIDKYPSYRHQEFYITQTLDNLNNAPVSFANIQYFTSEVNKIKADSAEAKQLSQSTQEQLDTIVIEGDSSVEAAQARKSDVDGDNQNYPNLKARLDTQINDVNSRLVETEAEAKRKKEPEDLSDRTLQLVTGGGTINVLSEPQYQSVTYDKTNFFSLNKGNLFNKLTVTNGILSTNDGSITPSDAYKVSDHIPVVAGQTIATTRIFATGYYDTAGSFVSGFSGGGSNSTFVIPQGVETMRTTIRNDAVEGAMIYKNKLPSSYSGFGGTEVVEITDEKLVDAIRNTSKKDLLLNGKIVFMFGDSTIYWDGKESWLEPGYIFKGMGSHISEKLGATVHNFGIGGQTARQITDRVVNASLTSVVDILGYTAGLNDATQGVTVGTVNDGITEDTFCGHLKRAINHVYTQKKKTKIFFVAPHQTDRPTKPYVDAMVAVGKLYGIPTFNSFEEIQINELNESAYLLDKVHMNNDGFALQASGLVPFLANHLA